MWVIVGADRARRVLGALPLFANRNPAQKGGPLRARWPGEKHGAVFQVFGLSLTFFVFSTVPGLALAGLAAAAARLRALVAGACGLRR